MIKKFLSLIIFIFLSSSLFAQDSLVNYLGQLGFQPVNVAPIDFDLKNLKGEQHRLSQYKGKWIWLNFWATWCGPCRMEMPTLESLHQEFKGTDLKIIGVSVDQGSVAGVKRYIAKQGITFPIYHDQTGSVSNQYQASSIPSIYLISPDWNIVGIFRGGKNWEGAATIEKIKQLIKIKVVPKDYAQAIKQAAPTTAGNSAAIELPNNLLPPVISLKDPVKNIGVNKAFNLTFSIDWPLAANQYFIKVPTLDLKDAQIKLAGVSSKAYSLASGKSRLEYTYKLSVAQNGKFHIGPLTLAYRPKRGGKELFSRHPGVDIEIKTFWIRYKNELLIGLGLFFLTLIMGLVFYKVRFKKNSNGKMNDASLNLDDIKNSMNQIKRHRLEGNDKLYSYELLKIHKELANNGHLGPVLEVDSLMEQVKFSGVALSTPKLKQFELDIQSLFDTEESEV